VEKNAKKVSAWLFFRRDINYLILLGFIRFSTAHYKNYLFPMPQYISFKTPVVTVFSNLGHLSHGTDPAHTSGLQPL
jgi:hypothetical protein